MDRGACTSWSLADESACPEGQAVTPADAAAPSIITDTVNPGALFVLMPMRV